MAELATVKLNSLLDDQKLRAPAIIFVVVAIPTLVSDGYDLSAMGAPLVAAIGLPDLSAAQHALVIAGAGLCITRTNFSINTAAGMIYPTPVRSVGVGWTNAAGRAGAFAAPTVGGTLLARHVSTQELLLAPAAVLGIGALCCGVLAVLCIRRHAAPSLARSPCRRRSCRGGATSPARPTPRLPRRTGWLRDRRPLPALPRQGRKLPPRQRRPQPLPAWWTVRGGCATWMQCPEPPRSAPAAPKTCMSVCGPSC